MRKIFKKSKSFMVLALIITLSTGLISACGGGDGAATSTSATAKKMTPHEATQEQKDVILGLHQQAAEGKVTTTVDQKFVNTNYMLTGLVNTDCMISENENGLIISVPSGNAAIQINLVPGIQNSTTAVNNLQQLVTTNYSQEGTGGTFQASLMGYNATIIPFTANVDNQIVNGFASAFIANQSLYSVNLLYYSTASQNELDLISKVLPSLQVIKPKSVDTNTKKATYTDPYASYKTYDPYLYYYISGEWAYEDYLAAFNAYYDAIDLATWDSLPYEYYNWYEGDYNGYTAEDFAADWDYYDDEDYWSWGWDEADDWAFYDEYADYYSEDYYDQLGNYFEENSDYDAEYTADESFDFSGDFDTTWEDVDLSSYDESSYEYNDYYDDYYYGGDDSSSDDSSYDDGASDDGGYDDTSYDDGGSDE
jgi:DNA-directed RNA polymerase subunit beta'